MNRLIPLLTLVILMNCGTESNIQTNGDLKDVFQAFSDKWTSYAESKDLNGIVSLYTSDAVIDGNATGSSIGSEEIRDNFKQWFDKNKSIEHSSKVISYTAFGDNAFVYGTWEVNQVTNDGTKIEVRGSWVNHSVKVGSDWKTKMELWNDAELFESRKKTETFMNE